MAGHAWAAERNALEMLRHSVLVRLAPSLDHSRSAVAEVCSECKLWDGARSVLSRDLHHENNTSVSVQHKVPLELPARSKDNNSKTSYQKQNFGLATADHEVKLEPSTTGMELDNHYLSLNISIAVDRHEIRQAYQQRLQQLEEAPVKRGAPAVCVTDLAKASNRDSAVKALKALVSEDTSSPSASIDEVIATADIAGLEDPGTAGGEEDDVWRPASSQTIAERNKLDEAYNVLGHPAKKKAYDLMFKTQLLQYEGVRIAECVKGKAKQGDALAAAKRWRVSLERGHEGGAEFDEARFNRVQILAAF